MTNLDDLNNRRPVNQHQVEIIKDRMRAEERLHLVLDNLHNLESWLAKEINNYALHGDITTAYALDDILTRLTRITDNIKETK